MQEVPYQVYVLISFRVERVAEDVVGGHMRLKLGQGHIPWRTQLPLQALRISPQMVPQRNVRDPKNVGQTLNHAKVGNSPHVLPKI